MQHRVSQRTPRIAIAGAGLAGLIGITGLAIASDGVPAGLLVLGASAATLGVARPRPPSSSQCARYQRRHQRLARPRPGAKLG